MAASGVFKSTRPICFLARASAYVIAIPHSEQETKIFINSPISVRIVAVDISL